MLFFDEEKLVDCFAALNKNFKLKYIFKKCLKKNPTYLIL